MGFETLKIDSSTPPQEEIKKPKEGLGVVKNRQIAEYLTEGNYNGLLRVIFEEQDKQTACEVIQHSMLKFNQGSRSESVNKLLETALGNIEQHGSALKELILYAWRNNLQGERFWKNPSKNEVLFVDDDGELISFQGEIGNFSEGYSKGMDYIKRLGKYEVLTGPNAGKTFDGSYAAEQRNDPSFRPIVGPEMKNNAPTEPNNR